jgi:hypothetical protein
MNPEVEKIQFLSDYLDEAVSTNDMFSVIWVATQINVEVPAYPLEEIQQHVPRIREKLKTTLLSTSTAVKFGI